MATNTNIARIKSHLFAPQPVRLASLDFGFSQLAKANGKNYMASINFLSPSACQVMQFANPADR